VEGRALVGLELDRPGDVDDPGLGVPGGELGQDLPLLPADGGQGPEHGGDDREQQQRRQDVGRPGPAAPGRDHPVEHALAEQQDHGQAEPVDGLDGQDAQELAAPGGPDEPDRLPAQPRQPPQRAVHLGRVVDVVPGDGPGVVVRGGGGRRVAVGRTAAAGRGVAAHGLRAHGPIVTRR
jgi:hypothetical protein